MTLLLMQNLGLAWGATAEPVVTKRAYHGMAANLGRLKRR